MQWKKYINCVLWLICDISSVQPISESMSKLPWAIWINKDDPGLRMNNTIADVIDHWDCHRGKYISQSLTSGSGLENRAQCWFGCWTWNSCQIRPLPTLRNILLESMTAPLHYWLTWWLAILDHLWTCSAFW